MTGRLATRIRGFGLERVRGHSRIPCPPAITIAFRIGIPPVYPARSSPVFVFALSISASGRCVWYDLSIARGERGRMYPRVHSGVDSAGEKSGIGARGRD